MHISLSLAVYQVEVPIHRHVTRHLDDDTTAGLDARCQIAERAHIVRNMLKDIHHNNGVHGATDIYAPWEGKLKNVNIVPAVIARLKLAEAVLIVVADRQVL